MRGKTLAAVVIAALGVAVSAAATAQKSPACKPVLDGMVRMMGTDHAMELDRGDGKPVQMISAGGYIYMQRNGKWMKSPMAMADAQAQEKENIQNAKVYTCAPAAAVPGVSGTAYHVHSESEEAGVSDGTVVLGSNGMPVLIDGTIKSDGVSTHSVQRYSYSGIHAPM